jgi:hypothetical protein
MTTQLITQDQLERVLPKQHRGRITEEVIQEINNIMGDEVVRESFRDNLLGYTNVIGDGRFKIQDYINAVKYVSYKLLGSSNIEAYAKTFPARYQRLVDEGASSKDISAYSTAYNKNQLVNKIYEQTLVPTHVLNADVYQKAINVQAHLMLHANSEKVRTDAANSLLNHLKKPEAAKIELDIGYKEDRSIQELREATMALARQQRELIESGTLNARDIAHSKIIQGERIE